MALGEHRGKLALAVIVIIGLAIYLGNSWINRKQETAKQHARGYQVQANEHRVNQLKKMVEDDGGTYYQGIGITPSAGVGRVQLSIPGGYRSKDDLLIVDLYVQNVRSDRQTINYRTWLASDFAAGGNASLTGSRGNRYARAEPADMSQSGITRSASIKYGSGLRCAPPYAAWQRSN